MAVPPCLAPRIATRPVCAWLRLLLGWPGDAHLEQAIPHRGLDLVGLDREWQRQPAVERAKAALHAVVILLLDLALGCARASEDEAAVVQLNLHVFVLEPRQVGLHDQRIVLLVDIHPRRPCHALPGGTSEERWERSRPERARAAPKTIHLLLDRLEHVERIPAPRR